MYIKHVALFSGSSSSEAYGFYLDSECENLIERIQQTMLVSGYEIRDRVITEEVVEACVVTYWFEGVNLVEEGYPSP